MKRCIDKQCPSFGRELSLSEFPKNKRRADGYNPYCRGCAVRRVRQYRESKREQKRLKEAAKAREAEPQPIVLSPMVVVKSAVESGNKTREAIKVATKLEWDDLGDALAELTFTKSELRIVRTGSKREFHLAA